jgi:hypothetical protein
VERIWTYTTDSKIKRYDRIKLGLMLHALEADVCPPFYLIEIEGE